MCSITTTMLTPFKLAAPHPQYRNDLGNCILDNGGSNECDLHIFLITFVSSVALCRELGG